MDQIIEKITKALASPHRESIAQQAHFELSGYNRPIAKAIQENPPEDLKEGGVCLLLYRKNDDWHIPLIKRRPYNGVHSAQVSFPGGKREAQDVSLRDTAFRETEEEIGVSRSSIQAIGELSSVYIPPSKFLVAPHIAILPEKPAFIADPREVDFVMEVPFRDTFLHSELRQEKVRISGGNASIKVNAFTFQDEIIWGATAMMINELVHLAREYEIPL